MSLQSLLEQSLCYARPYIASGKPADYIPALSRINPHLLGICFYQNDGSYFTAGEATVPFSIQSISKLFALAYVLNHFGSESLFQKVGIEPSGNPFYSLVQLEYESGKPRNPFINAGAIAVTSMLEGQCGEDKFNRLLEFVRYLSRNRAIAMNEEVYHSEASTGHRNRAVGFFMKHFNILEGDVESAVDAYFRQCALDMDCITLARSALFLANHGTDPLTGKIMASPDDVQFINALMTMCGLYDASGEFAVRVGIPAKSGVGGGILAVIPGRGCIAAYGPALNAKGNSIGAIAMIEFLSREMNLSLFR